jgi:hypothetical protein
MRQRVLVYPHVGISQHEEAAISRKRRNNTLSTFSNSRERNLEILTWGPQYFGLILWHSSSTYNISLWRECFENRLVIRLIHNSSLNYINIRVFVYSYLVAAEYLTFLLRIREAPGSNLGPENGYPGWGFRGFPHTLQANARTVP